jgi:hypothetical protein
MVSREIGTFLRLEVIQLVSRQPISFVISVAYDNMIEVVSH